MVCSLYEQFIRFFVRRGFTWICPSSVIRVNFTISANTQQECIWYLVCSLSEHYFKYWNSRFYLNPSRSYLQFKPLIKLCKWNRIRIAAKPHCEFLQIEAYECNFHIPQDGTNQVINKLQIQPNITSISDVHINNLHIYICKTMDHSHKVSKLSLLSKMTSI